MCRLITVALLCLSSVLLFGCGQPAGNTAAGDAAVCQQVNGMLDRSAAGELAPRDWANMMVAGARLLYVSSDCGERVVDEPVELCADLNDMIVTFAAAPGVPKGENRTTALNQSLQAYNTAGCEPAMEIE